MATNRVKDHLTLMSVASGWSESVSLKYPSFLLVKQKIEKVLSRKFKDSQSSAYSMKAPAILGHPEGPTLIFSKHMTVEQFLREFLLRIEAYALNVRPVKTADVFEPFKAGRCPILVRYGETSARVWKPVLHYQSFMVECSAIFTKVLPDFKIDARYATDDVDPASEMAILGLPESVAPLQSDWDNLRGLVEHRPLAIIQIFRRIVS